MLPILRNNEYPPAQPGPDNELWLILNSFGIKNSSVFSNDDVLPYGFYRLKSFLYL